MAARSYYSNWFGEPDPFPRLKIHLQRPIHLLLLRETQLAGAILP